MSDPRELEALCREVEERAHWYEQPSGIVQSLQVSSEDMDANASLLRRLADQIRSLVAERDAGRQKLQQAYNERTAACRDTYAVAVERDALRAAVRAQLRLYEETAGEVRRLETELAAAREEGERWGKANRRLVDDLAAAREEIERLSGFGNTPCSSCGDSRRLVARVGIEDPPRVARVGIEDPPRFLCGSCDGVRRMSQEIERQDIQLSSLRAELQAAYAKLDAERALARQVVGQTEDRVRELEAELQAAREDGERFRTLRQLLEQGWELQDYGSKFKVRYRLARENYAKKAGRTLEELLDGTFNAARSAPECEELKP
jgi:chromosome segregation ATPase